MSDTASWAEKSNVSARDLLGIAPNYTLGMDSVRYVRHQRGECEPDEPCALCMYDVSESLVTLARNDATDARAEVARLREWVDNDTEIVLNDLAKARALVERARCGHCGEVGCTFEFDTEVARADAAEAALAAERSLREAAEGEARRQRDVGEHYAGEARKGWATALAERDAARADLATAQATLAAVRAVLDEPRVGHHDDGSIYAWTLDERDLRRALGDELPEAGDG